jgi:hypothetical protein
MVNRRRFPLEQEPGLKRHQKITALDMYTSFCSEDVVFADELVDESAGIYPCYYYKKDAGLYISTSAVNLIQHKGELSLNRRFKPNRWVLGESGLQSAFLLLGRLLGRSAKRDRALCDWYNTHETIDTEILKVRPFESVTFDAHTMAQIPRGDFISDAVFIEKTAYYVNKFINDIENRFPGYNHVVLTGGKDSQLILLANKIDNARWNVFSAEPNAPIVKQWINDNNISINRFYEHDCRNEETETDLIDKIVAGDLFANPRQMCWLPTMKRIGHELGGKCFFWSGTMGDALMAFHKFHCGSLEDFYDIVFSRCISLQGNAHQVHKNFTSFPCLSPYHSKELWDNVFFKYDYARLEKGTDFRNQVGVSLAGRTIRWCESNPSPPRYKYKKNINLYRTYVRCIRTALLKKQERG